MRKWQGQHCLSSWPLHWPHARLVVERTLRQWGSETPEEVVELTAENLQPEEGATLVIWEDKNQQSFVEERARLFEEKYGVTVKMEELPPTDQVTKLTTDGPAGLAADVVVFPHDKIGSASEAGLILPNDIFEAETVANTSENALKAVTFKDILYGYPYSVETYALFITRHFIRKHRRILRRLSASPKPLMM